MVATMTQLISVHPEELKFSFGLQKRTFCDLKLTNKTDQNVAFKVKTTSPKKYYVKPNVGIIQPWGSCIVRVTLCAQHEYPPDMKKKNRFLIQSTVVSPSITVDDFSQDTFFKGSGRFIGECRINVVDVSANSDQDKAAVSKPERGSYDREFQRMKQERNAAIQQKHQLQQEMNQALPLIKEENDADIEQKKTHFQLKSVIWKIHAQYKHWKSL